MISYNIETVSLWTRIFHMRPHSMKLFFSFFFCEKTDFFKKNLSRHLFLFIFK